MATDTIQSILIVVLGFMNLVLLLRMIEIRKNVEEVMVVLSAFLQGKIKKVDIEEAISLINDGED